MFNLDTTLALLTLIIVPLITLSFFVLLRVVYKRYESVQGQFSNISAMAQENFSGIRVVKGFGIEARETERFGALNDEFIRRNLSLTKADGPLFPLMELLFGLTVSVLLLFGGRAILAGDFGIAGFVDFFIFVFGYPVADSGARLDCVDGAARVYLVGTVARGFRRQTERDRQHRHRPQLRDRTRRGRVSERQRPFRRHRGPRQRQLQDSGGA